MSVELLERTEELFEDTYTFVDEDKIDWVYDLEYLEEVMDFVTSDETGDKYFIEEHSRICNEYFESSDWTWDDALDYWGVDDIQEAIRIYEDAQI